MDTSGARRIPLFLVELVHGPRFGEPLHLVVRASLDERFRRTVTGEDRLDLRETFRRRVPLFLLEQDLRFPEDLHGLDGFRVRGGLLVDQLEQPDGLRMPTTRTLSICR